MNYSYVFKLRGISRMTGILYPSGPYQWQGFPIRKAPVHSLFSSIKSQHFMMYLSVHTIFFGEVNHRLHILRLCLIKERPIAHNKATAFANSIDEFLAVIFHLLGCA